jgi:hypothetical protein
VACITSLDNPVRFDIETGHLPALEAAYDAP